MIVVLSSFSFLNKSMIVFLARVEITGRLVVEDQVRVGDHRSRDGALAWIELHLDKLHLRPRELEVDLVGRPARRRRDWRASRPAKRQGELGDILQARPVGHA